jgi:hypothetical protein
VLRRDLKERHTKPGSNGCVLIKGVVRNDRFNYSLDQETYKKGNRKIEIDHVVSLHDAWNAGAHDWKSAKRQKFANDFMNLEAIDTESNGDKSDHAFDEWRPADPEDVCWFAARQVTIKKRYRLAVTTSERETLIGELQLCDDIKPLKVSTFTPPAPKPMGEPRPKPKPKPEPKPDPTPERSQPRTVHPGAFCSPRGATGQTSKGTPMTCKGPGQARWRAS